MMKTTTRILVACVVLLAARPQPAAAGLLAFYPFAGGSLNDFSGNGNDAVFGRADQPQLYQVVAGYEDQAYHIDATFLGGLHTSLNIAQSVEPVLTMAAWILVDEGTTASSAIKAVIAQGNGGNKARGMGYSLKSLGEDPRYAAQLGTVVGHTSVFAAPPGWDFFSVVYSPGLARFHIMEADGTYTTGLFGTNDLSNPFAEMWIGTGGSIAVDNVAIWDEALTESQILGIQAGGAAAITGIPEPSTFVLAGLAFCFFVFAGWRRGVRYSRRT